MRFAQLALTGGVVTEESRQLGALDVEEGLVALRAGHFDTGVGFGERGLDLPWPPDAEVLAEGADSGEQSRELPESGAASPPDGDCFFRERQGPGTIAEAEMSSSHRREHAALKNRQPSFPCDRRRRPQNLERIVPRAVQDVRGPKAKEGVAGCKKRFCYNSSPEEDLHSSDGSNFCAGGWHREGR